MGSANPSDAGWNVHNALQAWTASVDTKASFALTIESALVAAISALSTGHHRLSKLHGPITLTMFWAGVALVTLGIVASGSAVIPVLRGRQAKIQAPGNFVYFGHLRHHSAEDIRHTLQSDDLVLSLSRQLKAMSAIAWRKHRLVQTSMLSAAAGAVSTVLAAIIHSRW